ncbi:MAG: hypothetical protein QW420_04870 [Candidatus Caldarchaeum sp.]
MANLLAGGVSTLDDYGEFPVDTGITADYVMRLVESGQGKPVKMLGKTVGHIYATRYGKIYVTRRADSELFMKYDSFGISDSVLRVAVANGAEKVAIIHAGVDVYLSDVQQWFTDAIRHWWAEGHELQLHLPRRLMKKLPRERQLQETA